MKNKELHRYLAKFNYESRFLSFIDKEKYRMHSQCQLKALFSFNRNDLEAFVFDDFIKNATLNT